MLEQEFEHLLSAYFEDDLEEGELVLFRDSIETSPAYRRRFQREMRLHSLMREEALVRLEEGEGKSKQMPVRKPFAWQKIATIAAGLLLCAFLVKMAFNRAGDPVAVGHSLRVSDNAKLTLMRGGVPVVVDEDTVLRAGDRIFTGSQGQASFELDGVGLLTLKSQTRIQIFPENESVAVSVEEGLVLVEAEEREQGTPPVVFRTPKADVAVMGTVFGLEVNDAATRVRVHEGLVNFLDRSSEKSVDVEAGQYGVNSGETPKVYDQAGLSSDTLMPGQVRLEPVADACSDGARFLNGPFLKVEGKKRSSYLKFEIPEGGEILSARFRLTQSVDAGSGMLRVWEGSHSDWQEHALTAETLPEKRKQITERQGWVGHDQIVELDVSSLVKKPGVYTLVVTLDDTGSNDIWFSSKGSQSPPELILTRKAK